MFDMRLLFKVLNSMDCRGCTKVVFRRKKENCLRDFKDILWSQDVHGREWKREREREILLEKEFLLLIVSKGVAGVW